MFVQLDLTDYPFSRFGSYFSFLMVPGEGLFLHSHHGGSVRAFRFEPVRDGSRETARSGGTV